MAVVNVSGSAYAFLPLNSHIPGAKVCGPVALYYSAFTTYVLDLTGAVSTAQLSTGIQSVYIDASQLFNGEVSLTCSITNQTVSLKAGQQGYFPITVSGNSVFVIKTTAGNVLPSSAPQILFYFFNVPFSAKVWDGNNQANADLPTGTQIQFAAGQTSKNLLIASFVNQYLLTGYSVSLIPVSVSAPALVQVALMIGGTVLDADSWMIGLEPRRNEPMKAYGLNMLWQFPQSNNAQMLLFVTTSGALNVALVFWASFLGRAL